MRIVAFITVLFCCCVHANQDRGRISNRGADLRPSFLPWYIVHDESIDEDLVDDSVDWWHSEVGIGPLFVVDHEFVSFLARDLLPLESEGRFGKILIYSRYPSDFDALGDARLFWIDSRIQSVEIRISPELSTREWEYLVLRHELGHALGLADDPRSAEMSSIMADGLNTTADLTDQDRRLVQELLNGHVY